MPQQQDAPSLTVRAFAELLRLPAYEQLRILQEQKYPSRAPQVFRAPFYAPALRAIRAFYGAGNDPAVLDLARQALGGLGLEARRQSNTRVLDAFAGSTQSERRLVPVANPRVALAVEPVRVRLSPDLVAEEATVGRWIYYNCRAAAIEAETARTTLEIAHWLLEETGAVVDPGSIEFIDLAANRQYRGRGRRSTTIRRVRQNARVIDAVWRSI